MRRILWVVGLSALVFGLAAYGVARAAVPGAQSAPVAVRLTEFQLEMPTSLLVLDRRWPGGLGSGRARKDDLGRILTDAARGFLLRCERITSGLPRLGDRML
jgi:hypothetical protein